MSASIRLDFGSKNAIYRHQDIRSTKAYALNQVSIDPIERERRRLQALYQYSVLDTDLEKEFDDVARLASDICGTAIAVVNLIGDGRQFFKAEVGLGVRETPLDSSFCAKAILEDDFLMVPDATKDHRFDCNPLVTGEPHIRFYAGAILKTPDGLPIGTVCVLDYQAKELNEVQQRTLRVLATQVMAQLELRRTANAEAAARIEAQDERARYQAILESAIDYAIVVMDREGKITEWNEGATRILNWKPEEAVGQHVSIFFTPEDRTDEIPDLEMKNARLVGRGADERWHIRKSGERFWANGEMMPLKAADGSLQGYVKILRDRTGPRLAEERVRASEKKWRELFEGMAEGFFVGELIRDNQARPVDYRFLETNRAFCRLTGLPENIVGRTVSSFTRDIPQHLIDRFAKVVASGTAYSFEYEVVELGRWFEVRSKKEDVDRFSAFIFDITNRKEAEAMLRLSDERLKLSLSASGGVGLWDWMLDTDLLHGDENFARMYGLDVVETLHGITMEQYQKFVVEEDLGGLRSSLRNVFEKGAGFDVEYRLAIPGEAIRWVECKGKTIPAGPGGRARFSGTAIDITKLKDAEHQKQLLMDELAHRVKNTFSVVQAIASQTLRDVDPAISQNFQSRVVALSRAHDVLLQRSWEATDIKTLLVTVLAIQAEGNRFDIAGDNLAIGSKASLSLSLLMHEMATNAVKYGALSVEGGNVKIRWHIDSDIFVLSWREQGGPPARPPTRKGFGSKLIGMGISGTRDVTLDYGDAGLSATFSCPLPSLIEDKA